MTKPNIHHNRPKIAPPRRPDRVYSSDGGSLIEIHDVASACVVVLFATEDEGACPQAAARPDIRGDGGVWLHWSCACCGEGIAHCHPVEIED
jgi:hypothetical protein